MQYNWVTFSAFWLMVIAFATYNETTKYFATFFILGSMLLFGWTFLREGKPFYGIVFFTAAGLHHLCDFISCEWNPFGPWNYELEWGLFLYCQGKGTELYRNFMYALIEVPPQLISVIIIMKSVLEVRNFNRN